MMIPTMSDYASYLGTNLASLQKMQTKTKSFRIEDILDIRDQQDHIYTGVRPECEYFSTFLGLVFIRPVCGYWKLLVELSWISAHLRTKNLSLI